MIALIVFFAVGNVIAHSIHSHRVVPTWLDAPLAEKAMRLFWPTAIIAYLQYPRA